jgi:hypothetical protein
MKNKIMYIEPKGTGQPEAARVGRMTMASFSRVVTYQGKQYHPHVDRDSQANYYEIGTGHWYWISHCQKEGADSLTPRQVNIDDDVQQEYWVKIRRQPEMAGNPNFQCQGKGR